MKAQYGSGTVLLISVLGLAGGFGWVWNIVKIAQTDFAFTGMLVVRCIGVFIPPLGAVVGYF